MTSPARRLSSALQGGLLLQILQEDNKHQKIVSGSAKQVSTYCHIENKHKSNLLTYSAVRHNTATKPSVWIIFCCSTAALSMRRFPWHVLSKQRSCAPFNGILINTDVGNPTVPFITALGRQASFTRPVGTHSR